MTFEIKVPLCVYPGQRAQSSVPTAGKFTLADETTFDPRACNDTNRIVLRVLPHPSGHVTLMATLDHLGKGACGMAIQNLNLMLGCEPAAGLLS